MTIEWANKLADGLRSVEESMIQMANAHWKTRGTVQRGETVVSQAADELRKQAAKIIELEAKIEVLERPQSQHVPFKRRAA